MVGGGCLGDFVFESAVWGLDCWIDGVFLQSWDGGLVSKNADDSKEIQQIRIGFKDEKRGIVEIVLIIMEKKR